MQRRRTKLTAAAEPEQDLPTQDRQVRKVPDLPMLSCRALLPRQLTHPLDDPCQVVAGVRPR